MTEKEKVDLHYKEYVRLNQRLDSLADSSLNDFKLLGFSWPFLMGVGAIVGQESITLFMDIDRAYLSFGIFLALLLVVGVIAFRDHLKLSIINHHIYTIKSYEDEISKSLGEKTRTFRNIENWSSIFLENHSKLYFYFTAFTIIPLIIIPTLVLIQISNSIWLWLAYLIIAVIIYSIHTFVNYKYLNKPMKELLGGEKNDIA